MTKNDIILLASQWAGLGNLDQEQIDSYGMLYEAELDKLLERRKWRFLLDILPKSAFTEISGSKNLGYSKAYRGPSKVISVLDLDPRIEPPVLDVERALDFGIVIPTDYHLYGGGDQASDFVFVGDELYTDSSFDHVVVQYKVDESRMPTHFREALMYKVAAFMAFSESKNKTEYMELDKKAERSYIIAQDDLGSKSAATLYDQALVKWIEKYNRGSFYL